MGQQVEESVQMPLLDHLVELRRRLIWSFAAFILSSLFCYHFARDIYAFLVRPLASVLHGENSRLIYTGLTEAFSPT